ncbi:hypothetical protein F4809DRAFT_601223 [Biscogniauxia mediterranea]|nr:hypothetical protein F4809DRAFT_601223 [Biscogniauxia mediterranea]
MATPTKKTTTTSLLYLTAIPIITIIILRLTNPMTALLATYPHNLLHTLTLTTNHKSSTPCECAAVLAAPPRPSSPPRSGRRARRSSSSSSRARGPGALVVVARGGHREPGGTAARGSFYVGGPMTLLMGWRARCCTRRLWRGCEGRGRGGVGR